MTDFYRFPSTPHITWLGHEQAPREDKMLSPELVRRLLADEIVVEEKLDGANIGFSLGMGGELLVQNRGQYLTEPYTGQFSKLSKWLAQHAESLIYNLSPNLIIFGEWCAARHSLDYSRLPDLFLMFDVYDRSKKHFWSVSKRDRLAHEIGLSVVPRVGVFFSTSLPELENLVKNTPSKFRFGKSMEGIILRKDSTDLCEIRAKLVRADFTQSIVHHWSKRTIEWNNVDYSAHYRE
ncbi:TPA: RNA ligase family protein [Vibrio parahaemolyticus]